MRYVFVETNFVVELLRPLPASAATALLDLHLRGQVSLLLPWCCASEARRTLDRVISEDLGFRDKMMRFAAVEYQRNPGGFDKSAVDFLRSVADSARVEAIQTIDARIADLVAKVSVIPPSEAVVRRTLGMFAVKALKPFDEMVAGAVLHRAQELHDAGERDLHFCDLDRDLAAQHPPLAAAYAGCGLNVVQSFVLPQVPAASFFQQRRRTVLQAGLFPLAVADQMSSPTRRLKCLAPRAGFAFSGPRAHLEVGRVDPSLDRPFDRARVRRFVVTELKAPPFRPEIADGLTVWLISGDGGRAAPALAGRTDRVDPVPVEEPRARRVRPSRHDEADGRRGRSQA